MGIQSRHLPDSRREILIAAVRDCGNMVRMRLVEILAETDAPKFKIFCKPNGDAFTEERMLPNDGARTIKWIDVTGNQLSSGSNAPRYSYVRIKKKKQSKSKAGPKGSFKEQDALLVERMKQLIDDGEVSSVRQAAKQLSSDAPRCKAPEKYESRFDSSVVRRLQIRFSEKYPNYMNNRGQIGS